MTGCQVPLLCEACGTEYPDNAAGAGVTQDDCNLCPDCKADVYGEGFHAGMQNKGVWGGESKEWLRGFSDGSEERIEDEIREAEGRKAERQ